MYDYQDDYQDPLRSQNSQILSFEIQYIYQIPKIRLVIGQNKLLRPMHFIKTTSTKRNYLLFYCVNTFA